MTGGEFFNDDTVKICELLRLLFGDRLGDIRGRRRLSTTAVLQCGLLRTPVFSETVLILSEMMPLLGGAGPAANEVILLFGPTLKAPGLEGGGTGEVDLPLLSLPFLNSPDRLLAGVDCVVLGGDMPGEGFLLATFE